MISKRDLPRQLAPLADLVFDLRLSGSETMKRIWQSIEPEVWESTESPFAVLATASYDRLAELASDEDVVAELKSVVKRRQKYLKNRGWYSKKHGEEALRGVAYFSMEFGLTEELPIYSGGLGILAGDHLKSASDLGVPLTGVGLLYQQGYFRQVLADDGYQLEAHPSNNPSTLPIRPVTDPNGGLVRIRLELPGRALQLRVWEAQVGRVRLLLLDSNDPTNSPWDRGITAQLYDAGKEKRLLQEIVLGVGGWRLLERLAIPVEVCHLNEGHAAFAVLARASRFAETHQISVRQALNATRVGNVFTTHTPVEAAFDRFDPDLLTTYARPFVANIGVSLDNFFALGRKNPNDRREPFNMAYLAVRGCGFVNGVSRLHARVSRRLFQDIFPNWPESEVPIDYVTNGVHMPTWDSAPANALWSQACQKSPGRDSSWLDDLDRSTQSIAHVDDEDFWSFRHQSRTMLVDYVRTRYARQLRESGAREDEWKRAQAILNPDWLTLGFARRFTEYKRPNLVLYDKERFARLLTDSRRPVQFVIAGKAHPNDPHGKGMVREMAQFSRRADVDSRVVFLQDYDISLAYRLAAGIDVWLNNPRRPAEACGTSGMKQIINGGLNYSVLDGWWDEAYSPEFGWALGGGREHWGEGDPDEALEFYETLENEIIPEFYDRDASGIPRAWVARIRASMTSLSAKFSSDRMVREYVEQAYLPACQVYRARIAPERAFSSEMTKLRERIVTEWSALKLTSLKVDRVEHEWSFEVVAHLGQLTPDLVQVELYADSLNGERVAPIPMRLEAATPAKANAYLFTASVSASRPATHYTPRVIPAYSDIRVPIEDQHICWYRR